MKFKTLKHFNIPGHIHELTFSCFEKKNLLVSDQICHLFIESLENARGKHTFRLIAYVIMPDHVHLLISPLKEDYSIRRILSGIKLPFSMMMAKVNLKPPGPFWQRGGGYDRNIVTRKALESSINYIHGNPVRKGLVDTPEKWKYSSAGYYAGLKVYPIKIDVEVFEMLF